MKKTSIKTFKKIASFTLVIAILVLSLNVGTFQLSATTSADNSNIIFEDNFNRTDRDIHTDNGWYSVWTGSEDKPSHKIEGEQLAVKDYSNGGDNFSSRPATENTLNQRVSVDITNLSSMANYATANVYLRFKASGNYSNNSDCGYRVTVTNNSIQIFRDGNLWNKGTIDVGGEKTTYTHNYEHSYRIEFIAKGSNPTKLIATLYDINDNKAVATVSGLDYTSYLQGEGSAALGTTKNGAGMETAYYDNFKYEEYVEDVVEEEIEYTTIEDDFNREDGSIHDNNGWYSQNSVATPVGEHEIKDGVLYAQDFSKGNGAAASSSSRYTTDAAINQRVSVDILNLEEFKQYAAANVHLRFVRPASYSNGPDSSYYVEVTNQYIGINRVNHSWSGTKTAIDNGGEKTYYVRNVDHEYRIEFSAIGTNPTKLTATLYDITAGYVPVVTVSGTDSKAEMQRAGVPALGSNANGAGNDTAQFDNFKYEYLPDSEIANLKTTVFSDEFDRADGAIGNGWKTGIKAKNSIASGVLNLESNHQIDWKYIADIPNTSVMRPLWEAELNQTVSADFKSIKTASDRPEGEYADQGGVVIARCQGLSATDNNCYRLYAIFGYEGAKNWKTPVYVMNSLGEVIYTTNISRSSAQRYRLELSTVSISDTETSVTAKIHDLDENGNITGTPVNATVVDDDPNLQKAGTVGFSMYDCWGGMLSVDNFSYTTPKDFSFFDEEQVIYKTFEAEATETYKKGYTKALDSVEGASDKGAAIDSKTSVPTDFANVISSLNKDTSYVAFAVNAEKAGKYPVKLRYRFGCESETDVEPYAAVVANGKAYKFVNSAANGEFGTTDAVEVALNKGTNIIYCLAPTTEVASVGAYIDYDCLFIAGDVKTAIGSTVVYGDANGDSLVDIRDIVRLKKYLANKKINIDMDAVELVTEENEFINSGDLTVLKKMIMASDVKTDEFNAYSTIGFNATEYPSKADMLKNTYYKLNTDKKLTVGYIGGSVTQGYGLADASTQSWRALTTAWLKEQFADAEITELNGGIGGTGSSYGLANVVDLLNLKGETKPDLVFIEYAINDYYNGETATSAKNNMEYIIRTIYNYAPNADIVIVLTGELTNMNLDYETKAAHVWVAENFKLPYISIASKLWDDMVAENGGKSPIGTKWSEYFGNDWVHPNAAGNVKYAGYMTSYLSEIFAAKDSVPTELVNSYVPFKHLSK